MHAVRRADLAVPVPDSSDRRRSAAALVLLSLVFVVSGLAFAVGTPLFQNPDEPTHVDLARYYTREPTKLAGPSLRQTAGLRAAIAATGLRDEARSPDFSSVPTERPDYRPFGAYPGGNEPATSGCPVSCQNYQYGHPPAWYFLAAPVAWITDGFAFPKVVLALRLFDVLVVSVVVWCTWYVARQVWPAAPHRAFYAAALSACCGPLIATAAMANNDALMLALMGIALALMARILRTGDDPKVVALFGVTVGLGLLTKAEFLTLAPIGLLAVAVAPPTSRARARWVSLACYAAPVALGGTWWARVLLDTHSFTPAGSEIVAPTRPGPWQSVGFLRYVADRIPEFVQRFPGVYGWLSVKTPTIVQVLFVAVVAVLAVGWLAGWLHGRRRHPGAGGSRYLLLAAVPVGLFVSAAYSSYSTYHRNGEIRGLAPRYVYGAIPVLAVGAVAAVGMLARGRLRRDRLATALAFAGVAVAGVGGSFLVAMRGQYASASLSVVAGRAGVVAPVAHPLRWIAAIAVVWVAGVATAAWWVALAASPDAVTRGPGRPTRSTTAGHADPAPAGDGERPRSAPGGVAGGEGRGAARRLERELRASND